MWNVVCVDEQNIFNTFYEMKFLIMTAMCFCVKTVLTRDCYWNTGCKYKYFSSKTPYEIVRGDIRDSIVKPEGKLGFIRRLFWHILPLLFLRNISQSGASYTNLFVSFACKRFLVMFRCFWIIFDLGININY